MRVWDMVSGQSLRAFSQMRGPVTCLIALPKIHLEACDASGSDTQAKRQVNPLALFKKFAAAPGAEPAGAGAGPLVVLPSTIDSRCGEKGKGRKRCLPGANGPTRLG